MKRVARILLFVGALVPVMLLVRGILAGTLGVNPAETIQLQTGLWALRFLLLTLAVTPLRRLSGWNVVIQYRRMLGLFAFFYATLHLAAYIVLDQYFAPSMRRTRRSRRRWPSRPRKDGSAGSGAGGRPCIDSCTSPAFLR